MNPRNWTDFDINQISAVWNEHLRIEGIGYPVRLDCIRPKSLRLTPMDIVNLVGELIARLNNQEELNEQQG